MLQYPHSNGKVPMKAVFAPMAFLLGCLAMVSQLVVLRGGLAVFHGNELMIALMFVFWFTGIALGSLVWGRVRSRATGAARWWPAVLTALPVVSAAQLVVLYTVREWLGVPPGLYLDVRHALPACALGVVPVALLVGLAFPMAAEQAAGPQPVGRTPGAPGRVYWLEGLGSLAGGLAYTFWWAGRWPPLRVLGLAEVVALAVLAVGWTLEATGEWRTPNAPARPRRPRARRAAWALGVTTGIAAAALGAGVADRLQAALDGAYWRVLAPGVQLVELRESRYQLLALGEREGQFTLYLNGMQAVSFPEPFVVNMRVHFLMNQHRQPERVLVVGRGLEGEIQRMLDYPVRRVTLVSLDPAEAEIVAAHLPPEDRRALADPRLVRVSGDAAEFLAGTPEQFDLIVLHTPPPTTAATNRYYTREFFARCRSRLAAGGVLAAGLDGSENVIAGDLERSVGTVYRTLRQEFPQVLAAPGTLLTFLAADASGAPSVDPDELARRFESRRLARSDWFTPRHFRVLLPAERVAWLRGVMARADPSWENTERRPVSYLLNLRVWDLATGGRLRGWLDAVAALNIIRLGGIAGAVLLALLVFGRFMATSRDTGWSAAGGATVGVFLFGFLGMGLEILLLYRVQNLFGFVYSMMGALIGVFMLGLAAGAWWMDNRPDWPAGRMARWAFGFLPGLGITLGVAVMVAATGRSAATVPAVVAMMLAAGLLTGLYFPLAARLQADGPGDPTAVAGRINASDHLGALVGAGLTGLLFLPALGDVQTPAFFALLMLFLPAWILIVRPRG